MTRIALRTFAVSAAQRRFRAALTGNRGLVQAAGMPITLCVTASDGLAYEVIRRRPISHQPGVGRTGTYFVDRACVRVGTIVIRETGRHDFIAAPDVEGVPLREIAHMAGLLDSD